MSESKFYHFTLEGLFYGIGSLEKAVEAVQEGGFVWFNFYQPSREILTYLTDKIGIHPLSVEFYKYYAALPLRKIPAGAINSE
jgi:hypothetical protein